MRNSVNVEKRVRNSVFGEMSVRWSVPDVGTCALERARRRCVCASACQSSAHVRNGVPDTRKLVADAR
ncbi:hypothetical protein HMPREF1008_01677 [Olsenella sp. oral taxon 809 str. F0356]|nr:hypothetical protein HMPREF1008_01677 [Olsenella sp. oral taxon 809 str. F0356]